MQTVHILQLDIVGTDVLPNKGFLQGNPNLLDYFQMWDLPGLPLELSHMRAAGSPQGGIAVQRTLHYRTARTLNHNTSRLTTFLKLYRRLASLV
jgi:hypothetical protein